MNSDEMSPAPDGGAPEWTWGAWVGAALLLGIAVGFIQARMHGSPVVPSGITNEVISRVTRILCIAALSSAVARVGNPKLKWHAGVLMWWECVDLHSHGLELSAWSALPAMLCVVTVLASHTRRKRVAAWTAALTGLVLAIVFVWTRWTRAS